MRLYETMMTECVMMDRTTTADGMGGFSREWQEGAVFRAAVVKDSSMEARVAEKAGVTALYTITVDKGIKLQFHDVIKRVSDGQVFRVTSDTLDSETPGVSTFQIGQVTAERWELT